jgi:putative FmdB family regulatory protein
MPTYEYRCINGHTFEVFQSMSQDPVTKCEVCGKPVERVFHAPAVHFKGSGFYTTDYARKGEGKGGGDAKDSDSKDKDSSSKNGDSKPADSKSSKSETKSGSSSSSD